MVRQFIDPYSSIPITFQALQIRKAQNKDTIIVIIGEKRSGKSYSAIKIGEKIFHYKTCAWNCRIIHFLVSNH